MICWTQNCTWHLFGWNNGLTLIYLNTQQYFGISFLSQHSERILPPNRNGNLSEGSTAAAKDPTCQEKHHVQSAVQCVGTGFFGTTIQLIRLQWNEFGQGCIHTSSPVQNLRDYGEADAEFIGLGNIVSAPNVGSLVDFWVLQGEETPVLQVDEHAYFRIKNQR